MPSLHKGARLGYRDQFRESRARAIADAEGFQEVLFAIERLGTAALGKVADLHKYEPKLREIAEDSSLAFSLPSKFRSLFTPFDLLYKIVETARNDALHQGAYARHLTSHAIELSLIMEDALNNGSNTVADFMVKDVVRAELWQPLAYLRQRMLAGSFSFLPFKRKDNGWALVSDLSLACALRKNGRNRNANLGMTLEEAIEKSLIETDDATLVESDLGLGEALKKLEVTKSRTVLVHRVNQTEEVIGILTAFDIM